MQLFGHLTTTPRAPLTAAAGIPCNRQQPSSFSLGCQNLQELPPPSIMHRFGQSSPRQTFDVQRLMGYVLSCLQKFAGSFVVKISALVGYFLMCLAQPLDRFLVAVWPLLLARYRPLQPLEGLLRPTVMLRNLNRLTLIGDQERA